MVTTHRYVIFSKQRRIVVTTCKSACKNMNISITYLQMSKEI